MAHRYTPELTTATAETAGAREPAVGRARSGWYAAHACGWIETGFGSLRGATRMLERHVAFVCAAPTCHHP
jgi:hypothetical protein